MKLLGLKNLPFVRLVLVIVIALLVPVLSYTIFQFSQSSQQEQLIEDIYEQQLSSILFSANQNSWDTLINLSTQLQDIYPRTGKIKEFENQLGEFVNSQNYILGVFMQGTNAQIYRVTKPVIQDLANSQILKLREGNSTEIDKMERQAAQGYLKPFTTSIPHDSVDVSLLSLPVPANRKYGFVFISMLIDDKIFVEEITAARMNDTSRGNFDFKITNRQSNRTLTSSTDDVKPYDLTEALWILPQLDLSITSKKASIKAIAKRRNLTNLFFLIGVNLLFIIGIVYVLRNISKEISLAHSKTDFVANVSHELRTPLAHIRLYSETLDMGRVPTEEKKRHYYKIIMNESARLTRLINNILDFSKIESNRQKYVFAPTDLERVVIDVSEMYSFHLKQKGFELEEDLAEVAEISADENAIKQVLMNLLDNAVKFSNEEKKIKISLSQEGKNAVLAIKDFGIGIPEKAQKQIFDKFYRAESSLVHNTKGTGLGLALVKHIVEIHKGQIKLKSLPAKGSTFTLIFPTI